MIGTDFQVRVWEALLRIPMGRAHLFGSIAAEIGAPKPAARSARRSAPIRCPSSCPATGRSANPAR
jgi:O6-methylguanine-DNA--protein-cysteine methyltransferase